MAFNRREFFNRLRLKYKLVVLNEDTFEERASFTLTRLNVFIALSSIVVALVSIVTVLIVFTPLREYIPGYADVATRRNVALMLAKADSLERVSEANRGYLANINAVINGEAGVRKTLETKDKPALIDSIRLNNERPEEDGKLRDLIENQTSYDLTMSDMPPKRSGIAAYSFFSPIKGIVTEKFQPLSSHYGVDIASKKDEAIKSCLDGTVIMSSWTSETGYVIAIQHNNNLISLYKHNSILLKKIGGFVRAGEAIAIVGNTGEISSGPHLHFELWYNGSAVNPEEYINF